MGGAAVKRFVERWERMILLGLLLVGVPLVRVISERVTRIKAGGLTAVGRRPVLAGVTAVGVQGEGWRLEDHRGQVVVLNLWATWCGPCLEETPGLVKAAKELGDVEFLGLSLDAGGATEANKAKVADFARHYGVGYGLAFPSGAVPMELEVGTIPTTILIDREGRVAKTYGGEVTAGVLEADVRAVLRGE